MIKKSLIGFILQSLGSLIVFVVQFYLADIYGATEFGLYNYYLGVIGFISIFIIYGFQYSVSKYRNENKIEESTLNSFNLLSLAVLPIAFIFLHLYDFDGDLILFLILGVFVFSLLEITRILLNADLQSGKAIVLKTWIYNTFFLIISLIFFYFNRTKYSLLLAMIISSSLISLPYYFKRIKKIQFDFNFIKKSFFFFVIQLFYSSHLYLVKIIPSYYYGYELIAGITIAIIVSKIITMIGTTSSFILMPYFSDLVKENNFEKIKKNYRLVRSINSSLTIPLYLFICFYSERILLLIGAEYARYSMILIIISTGAIFPVIFGPNGTIILMTRKFKKEINAGAILISTFLLITFIFGKINFLVIPAAFALAEILAAVYKVLLVKKMFFTSFNFNYLFKLLFLLCLNIIFLCSLNFIDSNFNFWIITIILILTITSINLFVLLGRKYIILKINKYL